METHKRFLAKVAKSKKGCWEWTGGKTHGYGQFYFGKKRGSRAHRYSYLYYKGEIPEGFTVDHQCNNRGCVNPEHLKAMTMRDNLLRSRGVTAENARKKQCIKGHALDGYNLIIRYRAGGIQRSCRTCKVDWNREWKKRNKIIKHSSQ